jgi:hypothetical protein
VVAILALMFLLTLWLFDLSCQRVVASTDVTPYSAYRKDLQTQVISGVLAGLMSGLAVGLLVGLTLGGAGGLALGLAVGLPFALALGLFIGLADGSAPRLLLAELAFLMRGRRVRLMPMLQTALARQVLRQAGAVYQFRHADLQDRLAERYEARLTLDRAGGASVTTGHSRANRAS